MLKLKKISVICLLASVLLFCFSCKKTDDVVKISIKVENGDLYSQYFDKVEAMTQKKSLGIFPYNNGNITLELPLIIEEEYLFCANELFPPDLQISNANAKIDMLALALCEKDGNGQIEIRNLKFEEDDEYECEGSAMFYYSNENCNITGIIVIDNGDYIFNIKLKTGYNLVYMFEIKNNITGKYEATVTTEKQDGFKWCPIYYH